MARKIEITEYTLNIGCQLVATKMEKSKYGEAFIETKRNGKKVFVGWIKRWGSYYHVTFMGYTYATTTTFKAGVRALMQLGYALHLEDFEFVYGI